MKTLILKFESLFDWLGQLIPASLLGVVARLAIAYTFFASGRTKVTGLIDVTDTTLFLFKEEYAVPVIPPNIAAYMATYAEHFFPILLVLGLFTRFAALSLLIMTLVIQLFVYPDAWNVHVWWAIALLYLIKYGAGKASLDHIIKESVDR
ncbi:MAG: DoxX family protein [Sedimenticola sp.]|nr:DoxX family protein [Sedimenticola sp.]